MKKIADRERECVSFILRQQCLGVGIWRPLQRATCRSVYEASAYLSIYLLYSSSYKDAFVHPQPLTLTIPLPFKTQPCPIMPVEKPRCGGIFRKLLHPSGVLGSRLGIAVCLTLKLFYPCEAEDS